MYFVIGDFPTQFLLVEECSEHILFQLNLLSVPIVLFLGVEEYYSH